MRPCAIIPAFEAESTIAEVVASTLLAFPERGSVFVIDDGSTDRTARAARSAGALVIEHPRNRGKGAALRTGMRLAFEQGFDVAVSLDADGQHPAEEAARLAWVDEDPCALVLGIRDLVAAGAPRKNQVSNGISNFFLSFFARRSFGDTQCGLRRYPLPLALALDGQDDGYAFEAEIILRAVAAKTRIVEVPIRVVYPPVGMATTHFDSVRDPARIVSRVVKTLVATRGLTKAPRDAARISRPPPPPSPPMTSRASQPPASAP